MPAASQPATILSLRMMSLFRKFCFLLVPLFLSLISIGEEQKGHYKELQVLEDASKVLDIQDILNTSLGFTIKKTANFGYSKSAFWVKIEPKNTSPIFVTVDHPYVNYVDFYLVVDGKIIRESHTGSLRPVSTRDIPLNKFMFEVPEFNGADQKLYIRLQNEYGALKTGISYFEKEKVYTHIQTSNLVFFLFLGVALIQLFYSCVQLYLYKEPLIIWYIGFIFCLIIYQSVTIGYLSLIMPASFTPYTNMIRFWTSIPTLIFLAQFVYYLLDVELLFSRRVQLFFKGLIYTFILLFISSLIPHESEIVKNILLLIFNFTTATFIAGLLTVSWIAAFKRGHKPGYYLLIAQTPFCLVLFIYLLRNYGLIEEHPLYSYLILPACLFEMFVTLSVMMLYLRRQQLARTQVKANETSQPIKEEAEEIDASTQEVYNSIIHLLEEKAYYLDSNLKIGDLADALKTNVHSISKAVNQGSDMHFFDFINQYRVVHAKKLLSSPDHTDKYTLEAIASQSGFNTRPSFINAFKKFTGLTPSEFRKTLN